ncbi:pyridoxal phosphate-dependent aminotransferase [Solidesulfovibrio sp.]
MKAKAHLAAITRQETSHPDRLGKIRLDRNERAVPWPPEVYEAMLAAISQDVIMSYPEIAPVYDLLAAHLGLGKDCLLLSHASDAAIKAIFEVYVGPGDEAVILDPTYAMYPIYPLMYGAVPVPVSYEPDLTLPLEKILDAITPATRIVCLPNPNQPIERIFAPDEVAVLAERARRDDFLLLMDEAYHYFCPETSIGLVRDNPNVLVTRTFSKAFGLAGLRVGLTVACPQRIQELRRIKPINEINGVAAALLGYLLPRPELTAAFVAEVDRGRETLRARATARGIPMHGSTGNAALLEFADGDTVSRLVAACMKQGYLVKGPFARPIERHLRLTLSSPEHMHGLMDVIEEHLP